MPVEERSARGTDRCSLHPGSTAVGACDGCGRALCLQCAVPVRRRLFGAECLPEALGEDPGASRPEPANPPRHRWTAAAFGLAAASTALPWATFGEGSTFLGAWGSAPRWSMLAALAAVLGLGLTLVRMRRPGPGLGPEVALIVLGALVVAGSLLERFRPPFPSRPSIVPWVAAAAGSAAAVVTALDLRRETREPR